MNSGLIALQWPLHGAYPAEAVRPVRLWPDHFFNELMKFVKIIITKCSKNHSYVDLTAVEGNDLDSRKSEQCAVSH